MSILDGSNILVRHIWWASCTTGDIQREYWRRDRRKELDKWIECEEEVAWDRILRNIGPIAGASDGVVIASPSSGDRDDEPDYYVRSPFTAIEDELIGGLVYLDEGCCIDYIDTRLGSSTGSVRASLGV